MNELTAGFGRPLNEKSTVEEIRARFDKDVERFSHLETGQQATLDAPIILEVVAQAAAIHLRPGSALLDLGCGAGNFTLRVLQEVAPLECHLVDLSKPMLERASGRVSTAQTGKVFCHQATCDSSHSIRILSIAFWPPRSCIICARKPIG